MALFYRPHDGYVGDVIPFYWEGAYHAFYLKAPLPPKRQGAAGTPYAHVVSRDLVHWEEWPLVIEPGAADAPDSVSCFTGSVIERDGLFYLFYTGYPGKDKPQTVCVATSRDLRTWQKDPRNPRLHADSRWYEAIDWRDPFPFWNEEAGEYWMLLAARSLEGPDNRRGCIALATSPDLETWTVHPPFWSPGLYYTHECPDLFQWGSQWVLVYSTFSERTVTHYRLSETLVGPWHAGTRDTFDSRAFYAAKTASDGARRFVFGWNPTRTGETDSGSWQWGGHMVVHEVVGPAVDGELPVKLVPEIAATFGQTQPLHFTPQWGAWAATEQTLAAAENDGFSAATLGPQPERALVTTTIQGTPNLRSCGLLLCAGAGLEQYYQIRWEPGRQRIVFDRWPRPGDEPFMLECPLVRAADAPLRLQVLVERTPADGTIVVAYADDRVALSGRGYDLSGGEVGLFVAEGGATFDEVWIALPG